MTIVWCAFYLATIVLVGLATLMAVGPVRRPAAEIAGAAGLLGTFIAGTLFFWASLAGIKPTRSVIVVATAVVTAVILAGWLTGRLPNRERVRSSPTFRLESMIWVPAVALIAWSIAVVSIHALGYPLYDWDGFAIWGLKAKVVLDAPVVRAPYFHDLSLSFSHLDYPLLVPFVTAGTYAVMGVVDDRLGKAAWPFLFVFWALFLYGAARSRRPRIEALALTAMGVGTPAIVEWAGAGNADVQLTIFYGGSLYYLASWIDSRTSSDLRISFLFTAACVFTKQEGLALAVLNLIVAAAAGGRQKVEVAKAFLLFAVLAAPWLVWRHFLPSSDEDFLGHLRVSTLVANAGRLRITLKYLIATLARTDLFGILWYVSGVTLIVGLFGPNRAVLSTLTVLLAGHFLANLLAYIVTPWVIEDQLAATIQRVVLHMAPGALMILLFGLPRKAATDREQPAIVRHID
jgi:hypothetical protein